MDEPETKGMSDDGQTALAPSVFSDLPTRVDLAHCLLVVRWDRKSGLTMMMMINRNVIVTRL